MKKIFQLAVCTILLLSCEKDNDNSGDCNNNPEWIDEVTDLCNNEICKPTIQKANYNGGTVYYTTLAGPLCDPIFQIALRNCSGDTLKEYGIDDMDLFLKEVTQPETIYTCPDQNN